ncbi:hypothetical protein B0H66DRAFT_529468 [Apodospora peruviana]|uniref:Uncharacterized protein n=1 Tax=Apodospora peruviana TaxID=516989 RepID=A0AAE0MAH9_9PEZI|nr:hypothetical protein B0H66DRAFT_529468 [Apodospora peruviana]
MQLRKPCASILACSFLAFHCQREKTSVTASAWLTQSPTSRGKGTLQYQEEAFRAHITVRSSHTLLPGRWPYCHRVGTENGKQMEDPPARPNHHVAGRSDSTDKMMCAWSACGGERRFPIHIDLSKCMTKLSPESGQPDQWKATL